MTGNEIIALLNLDPSSVVNNPIADVLLNYCQTLSQTVDELKATLESIDAKVDQAETSVESTKPKTAKK